MAWPLYELTALPRGHLTARRQFRAQDGNCPSLSSTDDSRLRGALPVPDSCTAANNVVYSITSSARASGAGGTSIPSALAVCRLMRNSNLLACMTGRSAGSRL
jgi:hypothetical protein